MKHLIQHENYDLHRQIVCEVFKAHPQRPVLYIQYLLDISQEIPEQITSE